MPLFSSNASRVLGSIVRPLRRISQRERNREIRWHETVSSGWAMEKGDVSLTHKVLEFFYEAMQFQGAKRPERHRTEDKSSSGYQSLPERLYGKDYQVLPEERRRKAEKRGEHTEGGRRMSKQTSIVALLTAIGISVLGAACSNQPSDSTANSGPIVKTEPAQAASDKGDQVVTGGDLAFMKRRGSGRHGVSGDGADGGQASSEQ